MRLDLGTLRRPVELPCGSRGCIRANSAWWLVAVSAATTLLATPATAASPSLGSITPYGAQRGQEVEVNFNGARLADAQEILIYYPGITCTALEASENAVKARLSIAPECRLGQHAMRVRTASGISELRTFYVGALPEIQEAEPNSEFSQPQRIALDVTVNGVIENEDVDYFLVEAKKGERITAEVEGIRLGYSFFDPYVAILDKDRFELDSSDDDALVWQDGVASIVAPEDGEYIVQLRETAYGGSGSCMYRLHVGRFPRPRAVVPTGGKPGESLEVEWLGDVTGPRRETITLPAEREPQFGLFARDELGISPSPNVFRLSDLDNTIEVEPNDDAATATPCNVPIALAGVIAKSGDVDCFKFKAQKGQQFDVRVMARAIRSPLDPVLNIARIGGAGVAGNDDSGGPDSYVRFAAPEDDEYVLTVQDHLMQGGPEYAYRVEITPVAPKLVLGLPERSQFVDVTVPVPRGNRTAILVSAARAEFGGDLTIDVRDLPEGMTFQAETMPANQTIVPVLFEAPADAPLGGKLADVVGRHVDPAQGIEGRLEQTTSMVRGQNNIQVWTHTTNRMATAVCEPAPFAIEIVQPKVPLVRDGAMELVVRATRDEGYTAPITVYMLYNPPGVGSPSSVTIPEGQNEVRMPLTANSGAEVRTWKIAAMGSAGVGNGSVLVSSQLADLEVADPYFSFAYGAAAVEKGQETDVVITVTKNKDFQGPAKVELLGLPNEVTTELVDLAPDAAELVFRVKTTANSPAGKHKTLLARAIVTANDEPITHMIGGGELRIDEPLPPKPNEPAAAAPMPMPMAEAQPEKRLTRLEQLRQEREQRKAAAQKAAEAEPAADAASDEAPAEAEASADDAKPDEPKPDEAKPDEAPGGEKPGEPAADGGQSED